jgi:hypothetical protein
MVKRCCPWCGSMHPADGHLWTRHQLRLYEVTAAGFWNPTDGYPVLQKMKRPAGSHYGRCQECHEHSFLYNWQQLGSWICEGCIGELRDNMVDVEEAVAVAQQFDNDPEDLGHECEDFGDSEEASF